MKKFYVLLIFLFIEHNLFCFRPKKNLKKIAFNFENEDISNIINQLAAKKHVNIIFPQPPAKIQAKVTFTAMDEITIDQAWQLIVSILDVAGYTFSQKDNFYEIVKNENAIREPLELFVNSINQLPDSDQKIRYLYFFKNIAINEPNSPAFANIDQMLKDMLPSEQEGSTYILDQTMNSLIIVGKSSTIKSIMKIIKEIDSSGFPETIEVIPLDHTKAEFISKIIGQLMPSPQEQFRYSPFPARPSKLASFFSEQTKIIPIDRTNSLAILGTPEAVERIIDFIKKHLDVPIESEKSVLHVKTLQYLDADSTAPVIMNLIKAKPATAQAEAASTEKDTLANAIVVPEKLVQAATITPTATPAASAAPTPAAKAPLIGGNRLIVAARHQDWLTISKLIDELDQPALQVAIEVLVVDLAIEDEHALGAQLRNTLTKCSDNLNAPPPSFANFQTCHLGSFLKNAEGTYNKIGPALNYIAPLPGQPGNVITPQGLAADLLRLPEGYTANMATGSPVGRFILSFKNGNGISHVLNIVNNYNSTTILSQPFVVTRNNQQANTSIKNVKYVAGNVSSQSVGGPVIRKIIDLKADLTVNILPRISKTNEINLEILINVNDFQDATSANIITTRQVRTNANLKDKEVLVLGGLARVDADESLRETPILAKIPLIGSLFRNKSQDIKKNNLMIFIAPTIIKPKLQGGLDIYTQNKVNYIKEQISDDERDILGTNFEQLRDPITRVFFTPVGNQINQAVDFYTQQQAFVAGTEKVIGGTPDNAQLPQNTIETNQKLEQPNTLSEEENAMLLKDKLKNDTNPLAAKNIS